VISVKKPFLKNQSSQSISEYTQERGPASVMSVGIPSKESPASFSIRESTLGKSPTNVMNVARLSDRGQITSDNISKHQRIHNRGGFYKCKECGELFRQNSALTQHQTVHKGRKSVSL
jgi:hypothetical protein